MKLVSNFVRNVKRIFTNTKAAVKQEIVKSKEVITQKHQVMSPLPTMVACNGAPIPQRILNQRQKRKLQRHK